MDDLDDYNDDEDANNNDGTYILFNNKHIDDIPIFENFLLLIWLNNVKYGANKCFTLWENGNSPPKRFQWGRTFWVFIYVLYVVSYKWYVNMYSRWFVC